MNWLMGKIFLFSIRRMIRQRCAVCFFLMIGMTSMIGIQTIINLGVVVGLFPVTGVTLPLMSYGGTSLLVTLIEIGIMYNIIKSI